MIPFVLQVIGTLPLLMNPASLTGGAATQAMNLQGLQGLQVQTVSPQLIFNTQGQIIATIGNGPVVPTSAAVQPKPAATLTLSKPSTQVQSLGHTCTDEIFRKVVFFINLCYQQSIVALLYMIFYRLDIPVGPAPGTFTQNNVFLNVNQGRMT